MQVFNAFFKIAKRNMAMLLIYFGIFMALAIAMTNTADDNMASNFKSSELDVCVIDEDHSKISEALTDYIGCIHHIVELPNDPGVLQDNLYYRYIDYVLTIPEGFGAAYETDEAVDMLRNVKVPGGARGRFVDEQVNRFLNAVHLYLVGGFDVDTAVRKVRGSLAQEPVEMVSFDTDKTTVGQSKLFVALHYQPYALLSILVLGLTPLLVVLNSEEIKRRTICSSLSLKSRSVQLILASVLYSLIVWGSFFAVSLIWYRKDFFTRFMGYGVLNSFLYLLFCVALTLFVSTFGPNRNIANMVANVVGLSFGFIGGMFVPQNMLPEKVVSASRFLPPYWYIKANDMLGELNGEVLNMGTYWQCIMVETLFVVAMLVAALISLKYHHEKA